MSRHKYDTHKTYPFEGDLEKLQEKKLLKIKEYKEGTPFENYRVLKYTTQAFRKGIWDKTLINCRGTVIDQNDNIVLYPFTKTFNFGEKGINGEKTFVNRDSPVISVGKVNGFMASMTRLKDGSLLYATTGTLDSDFVKMAKETIESQVKKKHLNDVPFGLTCVFEICHKDDPHIVEEKEGAYLIGIRPNFMGSRLFSESVLDSFADEKGFFRPSWKRYDRFGDAKKDADSSDQEGVMIRSLYGDHLCKIKSKHYLTKKFMMRGRSDKIWSATVDEDYKDVVEKIKKDFTEEQWTDMDDQKRRKAFEDRLNA